MQASVRAACAGLSAALVLAASSAQAACPIEQAVYEEAESAARIEFFAIAGAATVTNSFRMKLDSDVTLDGIVQWSDGVARPHGRLFHKCPEGDATGAELEACTVWQGLVYTADAAGSISLLPSEGVEAPKSLILTDLGPWLRQSAAYGAGGFTKVPWDVFVLKDCAKAQ